jgi:hypothetical protein
LVAKKACSAMLFIKLILLSFIAASAGSIPYNRGVHLISRSDHEVRSEPSVSVGLGLGTFYLLFNPKIHLLPKLIHREYRYLLTVRSTTTQI